MIQEDRCAEYIDSLDRGNTPFLNELEEYALSTYVPIIRRQTQNLLKLLLQMHRPKRILEVGTAIGFSTVLMAEYGPKDCSITTIEKYEKRFPIAEETFAKSGYADRITFLKGDATEILKELADAGEQFDFIFMDAAKGQYLNFYADVKRMMPVGGVLVSDNVLQDGDIYESRFAVVRRNRTIHSRMREYLYTLTHEEDMVTTVLPIADGMTVSVKTDGK